MSAPDITHDMMDRFRASTARNHLSILLGAGASITSGLPDWNELARRLLLSSGVVNSLEYARLLVRLEDPYLAAEAARQAIGHKDWHNKIQSALYDKALNANPSPLDYATIEYVLSGNRGDTTLMTLNFDTLLEQALAGYPELPKGTTVAAQSSVDTPNTPYVVYHLHGIVTRRTTLDVVLTLSDFNELLADTRAWQFTLIKNCIQRGDLLIAGTSYRDPDIRSWLHAAMQQHKHGHKAYVLIAREGLGISHEQFNQISRAIEAEWRAAGLIPILLQDHTDAAQILRELRMVSNLDYLSPQERAEHVWQVHDRQFDELQERYYQQLQHDAEYLRDCFNADAINLSLWLADGQGHVARWASQDRRYRSARDLHRVDSGHDSAWVAGQALSTERLLFKNLDSDWRSWLRDHVASAELPEAARFASSSIHRWKSVIAIPVRVQYRRWNAFATAVLSVGLPEAAESYRHTSATWSSIVLELANQWSDMLSEVIQ